MSRVVQANIINASGSVFARGIQLDREVIDQDVFISCNGVTLEEVASGVFRCVRPCVSNCGRSQRGRTIVVDKSALPKPA